MENNNLPVNEPITEPEVALPAEEAVTTADTPLSESTLSAPVLSSAAAFTTPEVTTAEPVENEVDPAGYVSPTVEMPTIDSPLPTVETSQPKAAETQEVPQQPTYPQPTAYAQQPIYVQQAPQNAQENRTSGYSVASLVLGIISVLSCIGLFFGFIGAICGLLGIIFAICGFRKCRSGMNAAGLSLSIVGLIISLFLSWMCASVCVEGCYYMEDGCYWSYDYEDGSYSYEYNDNEYDFYA